MADSKYGQLFTEADVTALLRLAYEAGTRGGLAGSEQTLMEADPGATLLSLAYTGTIVSGPAGVRFTPQLPPDEPVFLLRGSDVASIAAIAAYVDEARSRGAGPDHVNSAWRAGWRIMRWQQENPDRTRLPE